MSTVPVLSGLGGVGRVGKMCANSDDRLIEKEYIEREEPNAYSYLA